MTISSFFDMDFPECNRFFLRTPVFSQFFNGGFIRNRRNDMWVVNRVNLKEDGLLPLQNTATGHVLPVPYSYITGAVPDAMRSHSGLKYFTLSLKFPVFIARWQAGFIQS